jgi:glycosyltransferase involved in cell wall biosynthesis
VEKLIIFPMSLLFQGRNKHGITHIPDHSDAIWLHFPWIQKKTIVTCHDLFAYSAAIGEIQEHMQKPLGRLYQKLIFKGIAKASQLINVSLYTQVFQKRYLPKNASVVIHNPLDTRLTEVQSAPPSTPVPKEYFLVVSSSGWRKQRERAIALWVHLADISGNQSSLVIVGTPLSGQENSVIPNRYANRVQIMTSIPDSGLSWLYKNCEALIQFSKYEGFGWPIAEANHFGKVAICSDIALFREVGENNIFLDAEQKISNPADVLTECNSIVRKNLVREQALRYSWGIFVEKLHRNYQEVIR